MNKHSQKRSTGHHHDHKPKKRSPHKDWRAWVVVGLMLVAIATYVLSLDESIWPGATNDEQRVPAAAP